MSVWIERASAVNRAEAVLSKTECRHYDGTMSNVSHGPLSFGPEGYTSQDTSEYERDAEPNFLFTCYKFA